MHTGWAKPLEQDPVLLCSRESNKRVEHLRQAKARLPANVEWDYPQVCRATAIQMKIPALLGFPIFQNGFENKFTSFSKSESNPSKFWKEF